MRDEHAGPAFDHAFEGAPDAKFRVGIDAGGSFVEDEDMGIVGECAGEVDQLLLAGGQATAPLAHVGVKAVLKVGDEGGGRHQGGGVLQGGIVSAMLDFVMAGAVLARIDPALTVSTASMSVSFLAAAPPATYRAEGIVAQKFTTRVKRTIKGKTIIRNASEDEPAYLVRQENGNRALKSASELSRA